MQVLYEDNHIIIVNKESSEIVQGDKTGDRPLSDIVAQWLKEKHQKPGNVFVGVTHRLDRPTSGIVIFAKTSKALTRLNEMFRLGQINKTYWAIVHGKAPLQQDSLTHYLVRNPTQNKSYAHPREVKESKMAVLDYRTLVTGDRFSLLEVILHTGRHHQIRCQLAHIGLTIKGDLKYGAARSNPDASISLLARRVEFLHPVSKETIIVEAPLPPDPLWLKLLSLTNEHDTTPASHTPHPNNQHE